MPLNLRKAILRNGLVVAGFCLVISLGLSAFSNGGIDLSPANLIWPLALAAGIGVFTSWQVIAKIKKGVLGSIPATMSQVELEYGQAVGGIALDWTAVDDYAVQLESRGFVRLGNFSPYPLPKLFVGVAACFVDRSSSTLVEVQYIQMSEQQIGATRSNLGGLHVSISSYLGGVVTVTTTDHAVKATNYLIRGDYSAVISLPGHGLLDLLDKHTRLVAHLREKIGKAPLPGLNMARYVYLQRERMAQARARVQGMSGYQIARKIDAFEANPLTQWATSSSVLSELPDRSFEELEKSTYAVDHPPVIMAYAEAIGGGTSAANAESAAAGDEPPAVAADSSQSDAIRAQIDSSANWFYWVAGLSLVNIVVALIGSRWGFAIGLGIPQLFAELASESSAQQGVIDNTALVLWAISFAIPIFFLACGWFARAPSLAAFITGFVLFALDTLIFVLALDWIGIGFHLLVLYYLWKGIAATREFRRAGH